MTDMGSPARPLYTERLDLPPWSDAATPVLADLGAMSEVVRHVGDGSLWGAEHVMASTGRALEHWRRHGFGWRLAIEPATGQPVGFIALNYAGEGTVGVSPTEVEIGWWLHPAAWGRGLAAEGAMALRDEALGRLGAPGLVARIQPPNHASAAVARKLGMRLDLETVGPFGEPVCVYRM